MSESHAVAPKRGPEPPGIPADASGPPSLKLATWNLEWLNAELDKGVVKRSAEDYARLRRYADRLAADVVAFQEVDGEEAAARVFDPARYAFHVASDSRAERVGFAYRRTLPVEKHADYRALDVGSVRSGVDLTVLVGRQRVRLLAVHLKSGCFISSLTHPSNACRKLAEQVPALEAWIDARAAEGAPFAVLGDFNRRLFARRDEPVWRALDDADPPEADLWSPTEGVKAECWGAEYSHFIDHIVLSKSATRLFEPGSFVQHPYDRSDAAKKKVLSDHCALSIVLLSEPAAPAAKPGREPADTSDEATPDAGSRAGPVKGNVTRKGKKLYHVPGCPDYDRVDINQPGERFFATESEAKAAGWTKAGNCP